MSRRPVTFISHPLTVYDTEEWNPFLEGYTAPEIGPLDLEYIQSLGESSSRLVDYYGLEEFPYVDSRVEGEEVGDDRVDFSNNPYRLATVLIAQEQVCGMVTSILDTNLSAQVWNFCEVTSCVPLHPDQGFDKCRKTGDFRDLGFIDVPPLRILLDVMKGDRSHSSTSVGKAAMLGSRMRTPRTEFLQDFHLASYLQDGFLATHRSSEPKYLPQIMGGSGSRALFSNPLNLYLYVHAYRGGICQRIYGSATRELRQSLDTLEEGERVIMPILNRRLRDRQEYLHGTFAEKIFIPTKEYMDSFADRLPMALIRPSGGANLFSNFENRLIRTRHVVTRSDAEREWENTIRIRERLMARWTTTPESESLQKYNRMSARRLFGDALNANTALANLLNRVGSIKDVIQLTNENFHVVHCGATHFSKWDAEWLFFGGKSENFSIEDLTTSEDLYLRDEVSEDETMRVGSIPLRPIIGNSKIVLTTTTVGLYQIGSGMFEWASNLTGRLKLRRDRLNKPLMPEDALEEYQYSPEWVNDDSLIISRCLRDTSGRALRSTAVILISDDKRLGNQLSNTCNVYVERVDVKSYIMLALHLGVEPLKEMPREILQSYLRQDPARPPVSAVYVDTGSVNAILARIGETDDSAIYVKRTESSSYNHENGKRTHVYDLLKINIRGELRHMRHVPVLKPKKFKSNNSFSGETARRRSTMSQRSLSSQKSWRKGI
jgi:hypothetical protein